MIVPCRGAELLERLGGRLQRRQQQLPQGDLRHRQDRAPRHRPGGDWC